MLPYSAMASSDSIGPAPRLLPEDYLARALRADDPEGRRREAELGLALPAESIEADTRVLLLRQLYLAEMAERRYRKAAESAALMASQVIWGMMGASPRSSRFMLLLRGHR